MKKYHPEIDGLRAFAVLAVLVFHLNPNGYLLGGYIGVDVFFVISGYLIIGIIYQGIVNDNFSYFEFLNRRIARLYPALLFMVLLIFVFGFLIYSAEHYMDAANKIKYALLSISNLKFMKQQGYWDISSTESPLLHTWSLGVEQQFYLIFPLVLLAAFKLFKSKRSIVVTILIIAVLSLGLAQYLSITKPTANFYFTLPRLFELGTGGIFAIIGHPLKSISNLPKEILFTTGFVLILCCATFYVSDIAYHPGLTTLPVIIGSLLCILYGDAKYTARIVQAKAVVYLGAISYSIYLIHWPLIVFYKHLFQVTNLSLFEQIILLVSTIAIAALMYHFIENRYRRISVSIFTKTGKVFISLFVMLFVINFSINYFKGVPQRLSPYSTELTQQSMYAGKMPEYLIWDKGLQIVGDKDKQPIVIFVGDSYLGNYIEQIDLFFKQKHKSAYFIASSACIFTHEIYLFGNKECIEATDNYYKLLAKQLPIVRVNNSSASIIRFLNQDVFDSSHKAKKIAFKDYVNELNKQALTNKMLVILPPPLILHTIDLNGNAMLMKAVNKNADYQRIGYKSDIAELKANTMYIDEMNKTNNLSYIETYDLFCNKSICANSKIDSNEAFYYSHSGHLSRAGAKLVWDNIGEQVYSFILAYQKKISRFIFCRFIH